MTDLQRRAELGQERSRSNLYVFFSLFWFREVTRAECIKVKITRSYRTLHMPIMEHMGKALCMCSALYLTVKVDLDVISAD